MAISAKASAMNAACPRIAADCAWRDSVSCVATSPRPLTASNATASATSSNVEPHGRVRARGVTTKLRKHRR